MTQAVTNFYLFINKRYSGDFQQVKGMIDTSRDDVIQYAEVKKFIDSNSNDVFLRDINITGVNQIWNELDRTKRGFNSSATTQVSENGSLNASEEQGMINKIQLYGRIQEALEDVITSDVSSAMEQYGISEDALFYEAAEIIASTVGVNSTLPDDLSQIANDAVREAAANILKEQALDLDEFKQELIRQGMGDYQLSGDENLNGPNGLLNREINRLLGGAGSQDLPELLGQLRGNLIGVIKAYMATAEIGYDLDAVLNYSGMGDITTWDASQGLNELQIARLTKEYKANLTIQTVDPSSNFAAFNPQLQKAIDKFIETEINRLSSSGSNFNEILQNIGNGVVNEFKNSDEYKALEKITELNGISQEVQSYNGNWSQFYGNGDYTGNADNDPKRMASILFYFSGLDDATLKRFISSEDYTKLLGNAYDAIISSPEAYGINLDNLTMQQLQNAIMKYFKDNISTILIGGGYVQAGTATDPATGKNINIDSTGMGAFALYWNFLGTAGISNGKNYDPNGGAIQEKPGYKNDYGNGVYTDNDYRDAAKQFMNYILNNYKNNTKVMDAYRAKYDGHSLDTDIDIMSVDSLREAMQAILEAIKNHTQTDTTDSDNDNNGGNNTLNNIQNPLGSGVTLGQEGKDDWYAHGFRVRMFGKEAVNTLIDKIYNELSKDNSLDKGTLNAVQQNLKNYYFALIDSIEYDDDHDDNNEHKTTSFTYTFTDKNGKRTSIDASDEYTYCERNSRDKCLNDYDNTSSSGISFLDNHNWIGSDAIIAIEHDAVWNKFKEFYNMYVG